MSDKIDTTIMRVRGIARRKRTLGVRWKRRKKLKTQRIWMQAIWVSSCWFDEVIDADG